MYDSRMAITMTVAEARSAFSEVIERVAAGEEVTLTHHGRPVAVVRRPDADRRHRLRNALDGTDRLDDMITDARRRPLADAGTMSPERGQELISGIRTGREAR